MTKATPLEGVPPKEFGDGWLTKNAQDCAKIAIAFGGFEPSEIVLTVHKIQKGKGLANMTTLTNALQLIYDNSRTVEEKTERDNRLAAFKANL